MLKQYRLQIVFSLLGMATGYLVLHPYAMFVYLITGPVRSPDVFLSWGEITIDLLLGFLFTMFPMSGAFAVLGGVIGFLAAVVMERRRKLHEVEKERRENQLILEAVKGLMVTLSHYLLNANMIIGGKVRHCGKRTEDVDLLQALKVIEEQGRKIDAVVRALGKATEIKFTDYTTDGRVKMIDLEKEIEKEIAGSV